MVSLYISSDSSSDVVQILDIEIVALLLPPTFTTAMSTSDVPVASDKHSRIAGNTRTDGTQPPTDGRRPPRGSRGVFQLNDLMLN